MAVNKTIATSRHRRRGGFCLALLARAAQKLHPRKLLHLAVLAASLLAVAHAGAGGSGLNVVVIASQNSSNSCELANFFCEQRGVSPDNVLRIAWPGTNTVWTSNDFQTTLLQPLLTMLAARQLTNQIDYVVLSMDIPFQTLAADGSINGTTSALFYGLRSNGGADVGVTNSYAASEVPFSQARPASAPGYSFLATMLTANTLTQAEQVVSQGIAGDGMQPQQPVVLAKSSDPSRNIRYLNFDSAIANTRLRNVSNILRTNTDSLGSQTGLLGYQTGLPNYNLAAGTFVPGALADDFTSFGGIIFGSNSQTTLLAMLGAGAAGSYGTVDEPGSDPAKFPNPQAYFYQARGFNLAESYYQSLNIPFMGLVVGEPLTAPFRKTAIGRWLVGTNFNPVLSGSAPLTVRLSSTDQATPLQQMDLFVDGKLFTTLTNLNPTPGNLLTVSLNGYPVTYTVPANASLNLVATGLVAVLNSASVSNLTRIQAALFGDRLELRSVSTNTLMDSFFFTDTTATVPPAPAYRVSYLSNSFPPQLTSSGWDKAGGFQLHVDALPNMSYFIKSGSNLASWSPIFTNLMGGAGDFVDRSAANAPAGFYRVVGTPSPSPPALPVPNITVVSGPNSSGTLLRIDSAPWPYTIEASTDSVHWTSLFMNLSVGSPQAAVSLAPGASGRLTTFLTAARNLFLNSDALGRRSYTVWGTPSVGSWLQLVITKTNSVSVAVAVTNQSGGTLASDLTQQLYNLVNSTPALQGADGVIAGDFTTDLSGKGLFNLYARSPGSQAAAVQSRWNRSAGLFASPSSQAPLDQNLADLQPRNHLYLGAGVPSLTTAFSLDTTLLPDGAHELTAVAYEGTSVRTQSRTTLQVQVQNTSLTASLTLLDMPDTAPVLGNYHLQVQAATGNISSIQLFSTGGSLGFATNQSNAVFQVNGSTLWAGRHPFYAVVKSADGKSYRTPTHWVRLVH